MSNRSGYRCAYKDCNSVSIGKNGPKETLFRFPNDVERCKLWITACQRKELCAKEPITLHNNYRVCRKHFADIMFLNAEKTRLHSHAVPNDSVSYDIDFTNGDAMHVEISTNTADGNRSTFPNNISNTANNIITEEVKKDASVQTPLTLSATSPRKCKIRKQLRQAQQRVQKLESMLDQKKNTEVDMNLLDVALDKFFPGETASFLKTQARLFQVKVKGRRYSPAFKQHCLSLYFSNPKTYKAILAKQFCMPSPTTLKRFTQAYYLVPGLPDIAFELLKIKTETLTENNKHCVLCIDEMSLKANLFYNSTRDKVIGFEDLGLDYMHVQNVCGSQLPACNVAVILVRGVCQSWKQPLAYFYSNSTISASYLVDILPKAITNLKNINLKVLGIVSDMGSNFVKLSELLHITAEKPYFEIDNEKIFYIFDVPHLLKATRNNLLRHSYVDCDKTTVWKYIKDMYDNDKDKQCRLAPKLTDAHINPNNFHRMKVKYATQVLSRTVSAAINTNISLGILPAKALFTVEFIDRFNKLFDILNSSMLYNSDPNKQAFTNSEEQSLFLNDTLCFLQRVKVITKTGKDITRSITSIQCWIITINSLLQLWEELQKLPNPVQFIFTRRLNQDALENFFGAVRNQHGNAFNPTPIQFYYSFKKCFSINYYQTNTGNCEVDKDLLLVKCRNFHETNTVTIQTAVNNTSSINTEIDNYEYRNLPVTEENAFLYICGYLLKQCFTKHTCETCELLLDKTDNLTNNIQLYSFFRAYDNVNNTFGSLYMPNSVFVAYIKESHTKFFENFQLIRQSNVVQTFITILSNVEFSHPCVDFPKKYLIRLYTRVRLFYTLKFINRKFKEQKGHNKKIIVLQHN